MTDKKWAVLKYPNGKFKIVADYGDYAWNSPTYELVDYFPTRQAAKQEIQQLQR